jgi:hypothetical protein
MSGRSLLLPLAFTACVLLRAATASAQACCAGAGAVTPARLGMHDEALIGAQLRVASVFGSYDASGAYVPAPAETREIDLEESVFGGVRLFGRGQFGALLPIVQTHRKSGGHSETGGGFGDLNLSVRYDPLYAGEARYVPGIGLLFGVTLPTGTPAEAADKPMVTDATGLGAVQATGGVALEQAFGPWLLSLSALITLRAPRTVGGVELGLAPQGTLLGSAAYVFDNGASVALAMLYAIEGDASARGLRVPDSGRRWGQVSAALAWPLMDQLFLVGSTFLTPPIASLGVNQATTLGATLGARWGML